jgi:hypothetical protein
VNRKSLFLGVLLIAGLVFMTLFSQKEPSLEDKVGPSQSALMENYQTPHSNELKNPLRRGEEVSLDEAENKLSFSIPQPRGQEIKHIWISINPENLLDQSLAISFQNDLLLIIHTNEKAIRWDETIANMPVFKAITVNGNSGMGADPGETEVWGKPYTYPGSVEWWVNGLDITLYSDTLTLEQLLKIAETMPEPAALPSQTPMPDGSSVVAPEWAIKAATVHELVSESDLVVRVRVSEAPATRVHRIEGTEMDENGNPTNTITVENILFSDTVLEVLETYMGKPSLKITIMQTGGFDSTISKNRWVMREDPLYNVGEEYILFLVDISGDHIHAPDRELYRTVNPFGRYEINGESVFSYGEPMRPIELPTNINELETQIEESAQEFNK